MEACWSAPIVAFPLYFDEDSQDRAIVQALRSRGFECHVVREQGSQGFSDEHQLVFAASRGWAIVTRNRVDFLRLHQRFMATNRPHAGLVIVVQDHRPAIGRQIRQFEKLLLARDSESMRSSVSGCGTGRTDGQRWARGRSGLQGPGATLSAWPQMLSSMLSLGIS